MSKVLNILLLWILMISFISCGDIFMKSDEKQTSYEQFSVCKVDFDAISKVMTENIHGDLKCLESNLYLFINLVEGEHSKSGYLSQKDLIKFVRENLADIDEDKINILSGVFDINALFFGDSPGYIAKTNVKKLVELLINFNQQMVQNRIYDYFTTDQRVDYYEHRRRKTVIYKTLDSIGTMVKKVLVENNTKIPLKVFIGKFKNDDNADIIKHAQNLLFSKKSVLGGSTQNVTGVEIMRLTGMLSDIGKVAYDFANLPDTEFSDDDDEEIIRSLKEGVESVQKHLFYTNKTDEPILKFDDLVYFVNEFFPDFKKIIKYKKSILKAKEVLLGNNSEVFTAGEVNKLISEFLYKNLNRGVYFYRAYRINEELLSANTNIISDIRNVSQLTEQDLYSKDDFNRISQKYQFFKGSSYVPTYDTGFVRNARGIFETSVFEDLISRFFTYYGTKKAGTVGGHTLNLVQLEVFMDDFNEVLEGEGYILPGRAKMTAETITLMSGLFHPQSDGTGELEVPEFVEFVTSMLASLNLASTMQEELVELCSLDTKGRYETKCFRDNIEEIFDLEVKGKRIGHFLPQLEIYLADLSGDDKEQFLSSISQFSRTCSHFSDGSEIPMKESDGIVTWAGLLTIEQSMIRFDTDLSGVLEPKEVDEAFKVYKEAVVAMIPYDFLKGYAKDFFRYIVKYDRIPEVPESFSFGNLGQIFSEGFKFFKFTLRSDAGQAANADRMTFASVLKIISENSPTKIANPYNCDVFR
jgi:hypothetical protein